MRVAWVVAYPVYGGPHNHLVRIAAPLREMGIDALMVIPEEPGNAAERVAAGGVEVVQVPLHRMRATRRLAPNATFLGMLPSETSRLARVLRRREIDVVVQASLVPPHGAVAARRAGLPLVWQIADTRVPTAVRHASMALVRRWSDHTMFCGERLVGWHVGRRALSHPYEVYYPPVDTETFRPSSERRSLAREQWGIPADAPVVGMVGNLNRQKGWEYFVRAAGRIHRGFPEARFLMVGASYEIHRDYLREIDGEIGRSGAPRERFIMTGECTHVEDVLPAFDIKLVTSALRSEGTPTTALEALACGVPVVSVDVGAIREVIEDGSTGFVARPLDAEDIADRAMRLLSDESLRSAVGHRCRERAVQRYGASACATQHALAFERAVDYHGQRTR